MHNTLNALVFVATAITVAAQTPEAKTGFEEVVLSQGLNEPLEMAILPDERVLVIERHGLIKLHEPKTKKMSQGSQRYQ